jgi:hypothetical protein
MTINNHHSSLFDSLYNVHHLIRNMAAVTSSSLSRNIPLDLSVTLKDLLIEKFIMNLDSETRTVIVSQGMQFKDWVTEEMTQELRSNTSTTQCYKHEMKPAKKPAILPGQFSYQNYSEVVPGFPTTASALCTTTLSHSGAKFTRRYKYCTHIISFTIHSDYLKFDLAAVEFNAKYKCNIQPNSKIVRKERCRKNVNCSTQLFKCNCCTGVLLQFRHFDSDLTTSSNIQGYRVAVFTKKENIAMFNAHYSLN